MPLVSIDWLEGRTIEQKKQLAKEITEAFVRIGTPAEAVEIVMREQPKHNFSKAGKLLSER
jgi:4-oxalocrotonate tautomerase